MEVLKLDESKRKPKSMIGNIPVEVIELFNSNDEGLKKVVMAEIKCMKSARELIRLEREYTKGRFF